MNKFEKLTSHIPSLFQPTVNRFIRGILEAWGTGDDDIQTAIEATRDQLFVSTASQQFLDQLAANIGVVRPSSMGMSDDNFRDLIPNLSYVPKQVRESIWKLLDIFYKTDSVYANFTAGLPEPYAIIANDTLTVIVDRTKQIDLIFPTSDFTSIGSATAIEVANSINKQAIDAGIIADVYTDVITEDSFVRIRTITPGPSGEVKIYGGSSQNVLQFPTKLSTGQDIGTQWTITPTTGDTVRVVWTGVGSNPLLQLVSSGDLIIIEGPFNAKNVGSFVIQGVVLGASNYVEITNNSALYYAILDNAAAINAGGGVVTIPCTGHPFNVGDLVTIAGTTNYDATYTILAVAANTFNITSAYVAETFAGTETVNGTLAETVTQTGKLDVAFYYPKRCDITQLPRPAVMYEINHKELIISIPSTVAIIDRLGVGVAHMHPNTNLDVAYLNNHSGLTLRQGDTLRGIDAIYLTPAVGSFRIGETITGTGMAPPTATVMHVIKDDSLGTILGITNVAGSAYSLGMVITGSLSGATALFTELVSTTGGTANVDSIIDINYKVAVSGFPTGISPFTANTVSGNGEGIVGRTTLRLEYANADFEVGEKLSSPAVVNLIAPYSLSFLIGETVQRLPGGPTAVVTDIVRDKVNGVITLQLTTVSGPFSPGNVLTGLTSTATGTVRQYIAAVTFTSGQEPIISKDDFFSTDNTVIQIYNNTKALYEGGLIIGVNSGSKGVISDIESSVFTYGSMYSESTYNGSYVFDPTANFTAGSDYGLLDQVILPGAPLTVLSLTGMTTTFPTGPGYFMLEYGVENQEGPIKYINKPNDNSLIIDPSFVFQKAHAIGANIRYVTSLEPTIPRQTGGDYAVYVTGLAPARVILQDLVRQAVAAGITIRFIIGYPDYRFESYNTNDAP